MSRAGSQESGGLAGSPRAGEGRAGQGRRAEAWQGSRAAEGRAAGQAAVGRGCCGRLIKPSKPLNPQNHLTPLNPRILEARRRVSNPEALTLLKGGGHLKSPFGLLDSISASWAIVTYTLKGIIRVPLRFLQGIFRV